MIGNSFALALKETFDGKFKPNELLKIVSCLALDAATQDTAKLPMDFIASYIHQLYISQSSLIRSGILRICLELEVSSEKSIFEEYRFDKLVAISLDQKLSDVSAKSDDEKSMCFQIIATMLEIRHFLPDSIIRALLSLYYIPKHTYKSLILTYLAQLLVYIDESNVLYQELSRTLLDSLVEHYSPQLVSLFCYLAEHKNGNHCFVAPLLASLTGHGTDQGQLTIATTSVCNILRTWPGLLSTGLKNGLLRDVLLCMKNATIPTVQIIRSLLKLGTSPDTVFNGYSGFLLHTLLGLDIIKILGESSKNESARNLLNDISRHTGLSFSSGISIELSHTQFSTNVERIDKGSTIYALFKNFSSPQPPRDVILLVSGDDPLQWDWKGIHVQLARILPFNDIAATSNSARIMYSKLLDFFADSFTGVKSLQIPEASDCLMAMVDLLLNYDFGIAMLQNNGSMKNMAQMSITDVALNPDADPNGNLFALFTVVCRLMTRKDGISILSKWDLIDHLNIIGTSVTEPAAARLILPLIKFHPVSTLSVPVYAKFLESKSQPVMLEAIDDLRKKTRDTPMYHVSAFLKLLVPHVKSLYERLNSDSEKQNSLNIALNLMCELMMKDEHCLAGIAGDVQIHTILSSSSHNIYSILLSHEEAHALANLDDEIDWWMKQGNKSYLNVFDTAVQCACDGRFYPEKFPSIVAFGNDDAAIPPHLFGKLSHTRGGLEKLAKRIPELIEQTKSASKKERRAAFIAIGQFASSKLSEDYTEKYELADVLLESDYKESAILCGTLVNALSMFCPTKYFDNSLRKHGWQFFSYHSRYAVIPIDPFSLYVPDESSENCETTISDQHQTIENSSVVKADKKVTQLIKQMMNPIMFKQAKTELVAIYREKQEELQTYQNALMATELLGSFTFPSDSRSFINGLFRTVPLMLLPNEKVDEDAAVVVRCQIFEAMGSGAPRPILQVNWLKYSPNELKSHRICLKCPEAYIRDDLLEGAIGMTKSKFYGELSEDERIEIRKSIISK